MGVPYIKAGIVCILIKFVIDCAFGNRNEKKRNKESYYFVFEEGEHNELVTGECLQEKIYRI